MTRLRLRAIIGVSFQKSEATNFEEIRSGNKFGPLLRRLTDGDVICMVSKRLDQLVFVHGYEDLKNGSSWKLLSSRRIRVIRARGLSRQFEPKMLANYAKQAGIELVGIKLFEQYYEKLLTKKGE